MYASSKTDDGFSRWAGNARFIDLSNTFIVAHLAHGALIVLWAGAITLFELAVYSPDSPMYSQGLILLPHLVTEGWGLGSQGSAIDTSPLFAIGIIHIISAAVLAFGAYFHYSRLSPRLDMEGGNASKFHFQWDDPKKLGFILGNHLIALGLAAALLVAKAMFFGGLYDSNMEEVRLVSSPTLDPGTIWSYRTHLFDVNNLEDLVGGHIYVAVLLVLGGAWHILIPPFKWVKDVFLFSGDGILSYSLFGIALAGFAASYYCGFNTLAYPVEFYGPTLELKSSFLPYYFDPNGTEPWGYTSRTWLANAHFYLAFFFLQGGLWHFQRAMGFNPAQMLQNWRENSIEAKDNPLLVYQDSVVNKPQPQLEVYYEVPQAKLEPLLKREQPFEDFFYRPSQGIEKPSLTTINGAPNTLYQTTFEPQKITFYQTPVEENPSTFSDSVYKSVYQQPKPSPKKTDFPSSVDPVFYQSSYASSNVST